MAAAKGMFGGLFARKQGSEASFVEITAWESEELHQLYADHHHPALEQRAGAADDVESAATRRIALERNWTVLSVS